MRLLAFIFTLGLALTSARAETPVAELKSLRECLASLHSADQAYLSHIPAQWVAWDRKLLRFKQGIRFLEENANLLEAHAAIGQLNGFLVGNAVAGCEQYRVQLVSRARFFAGFVVCASLTALALTLYFFLIIFPLTRPRKAARKGSAHAPAEVPKNPPQDVPVSSTKPN